MQAKNLAKWFRLVYMFLSPSRFQRIFLHESYQNLRVLHPNFENLRLLIADIARIESTKKRSKELFIANISYEEIALAMNQQIILYMFSKFWYRKMILICTGLDISLFLPLKKEWSECFVARGFKINPTVCLFLWRLFLLLLLLRNTTKFFVSIFSNWRSKGFQLNSNKMVMKYFYDFPNSSLHLSKDEPNLNFLKWYLDQSDLETIILCSNDITNEKVIGKTDFFGRKKFSLESRLTIILMKQIAKLFFLRNFKSLILLIINLNDISLAIRAILYNKFLPYDEVIFNASLAYARPLWSVALSKQNINSKLYFYANNSSPLSGNFSNAFLDGWQINNWNHISGIDTHQAESIRKASIKSCYVEISKTIPMWTDQSTDLSVLPEKYILVFDNNLHLYNYNFGFLAANGADTIHKISEYLSDVLEIAKNLNLPVVYKSKRPSQNFKDNEVETLINEFELANKEVLSVIREDVSPHRLIARAKFVIGKPISTTLLIANELNIKCAYYDVTASISDLDPEIRGLKTVSNRIELEKLIYENL